ncbi:glycoside hydrolase family 9 protein [Sphingomonas canadensis]|uniref:Endoglucanase n=1 Tax=Sphingomonas canadensis TaxID=1219257 RepID=A0ABW3H2X5_9SPHN|nr:glycoside hydrolase family 9 protein [Sphingomonas canadensis]MCW3835717.1 glycoside hydrolase family 9 protein [Sphingomonas canadensis]
MKRSIAAAPLALAIMLALPALAGQPRADGGPVSPIRMNQTGLEAAGPKRAMLTDESGDPIAWELRDARGKPVLSGRTIVFGPDAQAGESVHIIDFGGFATPGTGYRLKAGERLSRPFTIACGARGRLALDALAFFYHQRAGVPIEARLVGERWARPAGHAGETAACFRGKDMRGLEWPGCSYSRELAGGWYDAGDQGKYVVNGGISVWTLLNAYERGQARGAAPFADGSAAIPEAGNGVNDLLDEARFELEFLLKMQVPEGTRASVPAGPFKPASPGQPVWMTTPPDFATIDASGMAHQKVADRHWTALPTPPHRDTQDRLLYPPTTAATLNLAAVTAQCARIWRGIDAAFAARCLAASERAWAAALRNPEIYATNSFDGSGGYGDSDVSDEFFWAATELYATTGKQLYGEVVRRSKHFAAPVTEPGWPRTAPLGAITLATVPSGLSGKETKRLRAALFSAADGWLKERDATGYRIPFATASWPWGSTASILNRAMILGVAGDLTGEKKYRDGVIDAIDFLLGRNPLDISFVSGFGIRAMANPHHRFWAPSADVSLPPPPPGVLSGGPNNSSMSDPVAQKLKGNCAPMRCWADDISAYALNEVAINWNAPLVWAAAWLDAEAAAKPE